MNGLHSLFTALDWTVVGAYLLLTTFAGFLLRGKRETVIDFFLGGRSVAWPVVTGSLVATELGGVALVVIPGTIMATSGDFTPLQWVIGAILARIGVGIFFVNTFFEKDVYSPYDYMGKRIAPMVKILGTVLFTVGGLFAHAARVTILAMPLKTLTSLPFVWCILVIGLFAVGWTLMGGMRTVIWTDMIHLTIFVALGITSLVWMVGSFDNGWGTLFEAAGSVERFDGATIDKLRIFDFGSDPELRFTFWVSVLAVPFLNLNAYGVDHFNVQRLFCCRGPIEARKAILWSSLGQLGVVLMAMVGAALFVFYREHPPTDPMILSTLGWEAGRPVESVLAFPVWFATETPAVLRGLVVVAILAAAISSFDSLLTSLSQTTLSLFRGFSPHHAKGDPARLVDLGRLCVLCWGVVITGVVLKLHQTCKHTQGELDAIVLGVSFYTAGPLLGMFLVAMCCGNKARPGGLLVGVLISFLFVLFVRDEVWTLFMNDSLAVWLSRWPTFDLVEGARLSIRPTLASEWMWPVTTFVTMISGWDFRKNSVNHFKIPRSPN